MKKKEFQDVLTYKEEPVKIVEQETWELTSDSRYLPIIIALREGPMTVRDLEEAYNEIVAENIDNMDLTQKEKKELVEKMTRKGKTLYKYLDVLIKNDIITEAGKRIKTGQTATETLYGRTAKLFVMTDKYKKRMKFSDEVWTKIANIVCKMRNQTTIDINCFKKLLDNIFENLKRAKKEVYKKYSEDLVDIAQEINFEDLNFVAGIIDLFYTLSIAPEFEEELSKCFK